MKKFTFLVFVLFTFNFAFSQSFKGKVTYQVSLNSDTFLVRLSKDTIMPEFRRKHRLNRVATAKPTNFHLFFNGNESLYKSEYDMETKRNMGTVMNKTDNVAKGHCTYYTNIQSKEKVYQSFFTQQMAGDSLISSVLALNASPQTAIVELFL